MCLELQIGFHNHSFENHLIWRPVSSCRNSWITHWLLLVNQWWSKVLKTVRTLNSSCTVCQREKLYFAQWFDSTGSSCCPLFLSSVHPLLTCKNFTCLCLSLNVYLWFIADDLLRHFFFLRCNREPVRNAVQIVHLECRINLPTLLLNESNKLLNNKRCV